MSSLEVPPLGECAGARYCLDLEAWLTLRECVEKLQELGSPAFRAAKLQARPEVTADPHMDPGYESDVNEISPLQGNVHPLRIGLKKNKSDLVGGMASGFECLTSRVCRFVLRQSCYWETDNVIFLCHSR